MTEKKDINKIVDDLLDWLNTNDPLKYPKEFRITLASRIGLVSKGVNNWVDEEENK